MNNYTERTWTLVTINQAIADLMKTYVKYPPRKLQSDGYDGPDHHFQLSRSSSGFVTSSRKKALTFRCLQATNGCAEGRPTSGRPLVAKGRNIACCSTANLSRRLLLATLAVLPVVNRSFGLGSISALAEGDPQ